MVTANQKPDTCATWQALKALGNPVRFAIVQFIRQHPRCISNEILFQLPDDCSRAQSTLSQHLKVLRQAGVVLIDSDGALTCYTVNEARIAGLSRELNDLLPDAVRQ